MPRRGAKTEPDLFTLPERRIEPAPLPSRPVLLPDDLVCSLRLFADAELERLQAAVVNEVARRGPPNSPFGAPEPTPNNPTMVLSNPDPSGAVPELPETRATERVGSPRIAGVAEPAPTPVTPAEGRRPGGRIAAIDAEDGGRLFVSGQAAPGATVRLYLNETLIAPGAVGADGKLAFVINRGVKPGSYRV